MSARIGIRNEDKYSMERRTPLIPSHVKSLIQNFNLDITIQSSSKRIFPDQQYIEAGANVHSSLSHCDIILGVKEIPIEALEADKTYVFFSHVIKGQLHNMGMLQRLMDLGCNLIDYERITDNQNRRLIFFGKYAGMAGMINSLWSLGQRLRIEGFENNPFLKIRQAYTYNSLEEAMSDVMDTGQTIARDGLPTTLTPLVIGITGYGNVSEGAQKILSLLPQIEITPEELPGLKMNKTISGNHVFKVVFKEHHISKHKESDQPFTLEHYYKHPEDYINIFGQYIPHLCIIMNCMYWDDRFPRIVTREFAYNLFSQSNPRIKVIGDITCDPGGSVEFTHTGTGIENPVYVYDPIEETATVGFSGRGIVVMAVEILPSELPRESSQAFSQVLFKYIGSLATTDFNDRFENLTLPEPLKKALILHKGKLTPDYRYLARYLEVNNVKT